MFSTLYTCRNNKPVYTVQHSEGGIRIRLVVLDKKEAPPNAEMHFANTPRLSLGDIKRGV
jgi:hypothetical protein